MEVHEKLAVVVRDDKKQKNKKDKRKKSSHSERRKEKIERHEDKMKMKLINKTIKPSKIMDPESAQCNSSEKPCSSEKQYSSVKAGTKRKKDLEREKKKKKRRKESHSKAQKNNREPFEISTEKDTTEQHCNRSTNGNDKDVEFCKCVEEELTERQVDEEVVNRKGPVMKHNPLHSSWKFSKEEIKSIKGKGVKLKMGQWSNQEIETLQQNMEDYLMENKLKDPGPLIYRKEYNDKDSESLARKTQFYQCLAKGIDRPLFNIYKRVQRMYDPTNYVGEWSKRDTDDLLRYHACYGDQWTKIGKFLGRSGMAVNHKYLLLKKISPGYCRWTKREEDLLNGAVRAATGTDFAAPISNSIDWSVVSVFVGSRTPEQCRKKWLRHVCWADVHGDVNIKWNNLDDAQLIERLYSGVEVDENDIDWVKISKEFANSPSYEWLRLRWYTLKKAAPNFSDCDFEELLDYLHTVHRPLLKKVASSEVEDVPLNNDDL